MEHVACHVQHVDFVLISMLQLANAELKSGLMNLEPTEISHLLTTNGNTALTV